MRRLVRRYRSRPAIRRAALDAVEEYAEVPHGPFGYADLAAHPERVAVALWLYVAERVAYVSDPHRTELIQSPDLTLAVGMGDCDDLTVLVEAMAQSLGLQTRAVVAGFDERGFDHVWPEVAVGRGTGNGSWQALDVTIAAPGMTTDGLVRARTYDADDGLTWEGPADQLHLEDFPTIIDDTDMDELGNPYGGGGFGFDLGGGGGFGYDSGGFGYNPGIPGGYGYDPTGGGGFDFNFGGGDPFTSGYNSNLDFLGLGNITPDAIQGWLGVLDGIARVFGWGRYDGGGLRDGEVIVTDPRTGQRYVTTREQAQQQVAQGVLTENEDGSYSVTQQAMQHYGGQVAQGGLFGSLTGVLLVGAAVALAVNAMRK